MQSICGMRGLHERKPAIRHGGRHFRAGGRRTLLRSGSVVEPTPLGELNMTSSVTWSLAFSAWLIAPTVALAHDWYPLSCCSERDCHPLFEESGETVTETPEGWQLWDGRRVERNLVKLSPDRRFHLCETSTKTILCFFAPVGGS